MLGFGGATGRVEEGPSQTCRELDEPKEGMARTRNEGLGFV